MNISTVVLLITLYFALSLLSLYWAVCAIRGHLRKAVKRIRRQRNEDLRWHRDSLLSHMQLEEARRGLDRLSSKRAPQQ
jgi:hypothetical protein